MNLNQIIYKKNTDQRISNAKQEITNHTYKKNYKSCKNL